MQTIVCVIYSSPSTGEIRRLSTIVMDVIYHLAETKGAVTAILLTGLEATSDYST
jgi:hypothetical protein